MLRILLVGISLISFHLLSTTSFISHTAEPVVGKEKIVNISDIEYKDGVYLFEKKMFNGKIVDYYLNKSLKYKCQVLDGRLHGFTYEYFDNGDIKSERKYNYGKLFGPFTEYFENGKVRVKANVKNFNYHGGEDIENVTYAYLKKGRTKTSELKKGKIIFLSETGKRYKSSEEIPIYQQGKYIITTLDEKKILLEVK
jgi:antitoxin component YwqK of YwqJK toxin-antitoxin module